MRPYTLNNHPYGRFPQAARSDRLDRNLIIFVRQTGKLAKLTQCSKMRGNLDLTRHLPVRPLNLSSGNVYLLDAPYFIILLRLMSEDFTRQEKSDPFE